MNWFCLVGKRSQTRIVIPHMLIGTATRIRVVVEAPERSENDSYKLFGQFDLVIELSITHVVSWPSSYRPYSMSLGCRAPYFW
jgi:hypothetical protein